MENTDGSYPIEPNETQSLTGTTDTETNAAANTYTGFEANAFDQANINGDDTTIIDIYYSRLSYQIIYHLDGGDNGNNPSSFKYGVDVLALEPATKTGYEFEGWYADSNFENAISSIDASVLNDVDIYAKFERISFTVDFDNQGHGSAVQSQTIFYGDLIVEPSEPDVTLTETGYTFDGWYTDAACTDQCKWDFANNGVFAATILYAKWTPITYTIKFEGGSGVQETMQDQVLTYDSASNLNANTFNKEGYTFAGWQDDSGNEYLDGAEVINLASVQNAEVILHAVWNAVVNPDEPVDPEQPDDPDVDPDDPDDPDNPVDPDDPDQPDQTKKWTRLSGGTALSTMRAIINAGWETSEWAIIATSQGYQDALSASALAGLLDNAPVLLTKSNELSSQTKNLLTGKSVKKALIVGGPGAISDDVVAEIKSLGIDYVERIAGGTATTTAISVYKWGADASKTGGTTWGKDAIVATLDSFQDALSIAPYAYAKNAPIFLADKGTKDIRSSVQSLIANGGFDRTLIVGGTGAVSDTVEGKVIDAQRLAGGTAYTTSKAIANFALAEGMNATSMGVACGTSYQDALVGASFLGKLGSIIALADDKNSTTINSVVAKNKDSLSECYIFGGTAAVSQTIEDKLNAVIK